MRRFALLAAVLSLAAAPALAQTDSRAEELRAEIQSFLEDNSSLLGENALSHGPVAVVEEDAGLRVTIPNLVLADQIDRTRLPIGAVSFLVTPRADGRYAFSEVELPQRIASLDEAGAEVGSLVFNLVTLTGIWSPELGELTDLDLLLRGLEFRSNKAGVLLGLGLAAAEVATQEDAAGLWDQTQDYRLESLVVADQDLVVELQGISLNSKVEGLDPEAYRTLVALFQDLETAAEAGDEARLEALRQSLAAVGPLADGLQQRLELTGIVGSDETGREVLRLTRAGFTLSGDTRREADSASASLALDGEGLALDLPPDSEFRSYAELIPQRWNLPLTLENLPVEAASKAFSDLLFVLARNPAANPEVPMTAALETLLRAMGSAGSRLLVRGLFIESPLSRLDGKAAFTFDPELPFGLVGNADLVVTGVDRMLVLAESLQDPNAKQVLSAVALGLMGVGQASALPDGKVGYRYSFLFSPDGKVSMNGFAFGDLLNRAIPQ